MRVMLIKMYGTNYHFIFPASLSKRVQALQRFVIFLFYIIEKVAIVRCLHRHACFSCCTDFRRYDVAYACSLVRDESVA
jgi:hypothetical protein